MQSEQINPNLTPLAPKKSCSNISIEILELEAGLSLKKLKKEADAIAKYSFSNFCLMDPVQESKKLEETRNIIARNISMRIMAQKINKTSLEYAHPLYLIDKNDKLICGAYCCMIKALSDIQYYPNNNQVLKDSFNLCIYFKEYVCCKNQFEILMCDLLNLEQTARRFIDCPKIITSKTITAICNNIIRQLTAIAFCKAERTSREKISSFKRNMLAIIKDVNRNTSEGNIVYQSKCFDWATSQWVCTKVSNSVESIIEFAKNEL